ncbi:MULTISPECIES: glycyl-radical enzyme activating protein [Clostridia]|uniref:glycyl-radical enzyme activating protein n=1 Tax=Anaerovoracaceae TaxID=543314 RepID=UPI00137A698A|nr:MULTISPECIES: glycyl-radical enzyme activating protein [Clostridia]NCE97832.1 glycyl-radical enzyme activating protein [Emergencia sp. 1XD21-10]
MTYITNIQKYCIHDGAGIRTTVFFKGCPLKCKWCHNPETQNPDRQIRIFQERCVSCGGCIKTCGIGAIQMQEDGISVDMNLCRKCGKCVDSCKHQALERVGRSYEAAKLVKMLEADQIFYEESDGGVTLSGGEVMGVETGYLKNLVQALYDRGISVNIDTCGFCSWEKFEEILPYIDTFLYDLKALDLEKHQHYTGVDNNLILENLQKLSKTGAKIWLRLPLAKPVNSSSEDIESVGRWLRENHIAPAQINLIPYHDHGKDKYRQLGETYEDVFAPPTDGELSDYQNILQQMGFQNVKIGG